MTVSSWSKLTSALIPLHPIKTRILILHSLCLIHSWIHDSNHASAPSAFYLLITRSVKSYISFSHDSQLLLITTRFRESFSTFLKHHRCRTSSHSAHVSIPTSISSKSPTFNRYSLIISTRKYLNISVTSPQPDKHE